ncbi:hypothetical protein [Methanosphaerula palustris]|uniref:Uncharacterized protein n=1 Tax=Methanosphaerula palustris (strain ATCC BAA-1556 / DSM 19958 / E1-9c) TaxID=521011 RepID=B8GFF7_METPE|nr:hypothetical protein [Methanosphaerula palustris]ACL16005.1 hypothetical protein Mpal_0634 [Methanosphaerula palustris E1-9c]
MFIRIEITMSQAIVFWEPLISSVSLFTIAVGLLCSSKTIGEHGRLYLYNITMAIEPLIGNPANESTLRKTRV